MKANQKLHQRFCGGVSLIKILGTDVLRMDANWKHSNFFTPRQFVIIDFTYHDAVWTADWFNECSLQNNWISRMCQNIPFWLHNLSLKLRKRSKGFIYLYLPYIVFVI